MLELFVLHFCVVVYSCLCAHPHRAHLLLFAVAKPWLYAHDMPHHDCFDHVDGEKYRC